VKAREEAALHQQVHRLGVARDEFLGTLAKATSLEHDLLNHVDRIRRLVPADGAAVLIKDKVRRVGHAPIDAQIRELTAWVLNSSPSEPFATNSLVRRYSPAEAYVAEASGLLANVVSCAEPIVLLWFRAEHIETINWAGNPHKPAKPGEELGALTPRKSFETWKEMVRHQSLPWSVAEVDAARRLRRAILDLSQQATLRELNVQLRRALSDKELLLTQKDLLMQEVNHRVQNSLQLVNSMLHLQARQTSDAQVKSQFEEASRRILAISTVHHRLWSSDHISSIDLGSYLEELRDGLLETWGSSWAGHIKVHAQPLLIPTNQAVVLAIVVTELLTNAVKYAYEGQPGPIDVTVREEGRKAFRVTVKDQGIGMQAKEPSTGLGSRLMRSLIAQLQGELEVTAVSPGTSIAFTVPLATNTSGPA
jgi:light-regulated signal transduction histidine kinase (bacteriophytochrome)